jgi:transposase InsO family protein
LGIEHNRRHWPVSLACEVLRVSPSGYHEHHHRRARARGAARGHTGRGRIGNDALLLHIRAVHAQSKGEYGWPRIWKELLAHGIRVGKERVRKHMKLHGIKAKTKPRYKTTTDSKHSLPVADNLLQRNFTPDAPDRVYGSDITYVATDEGWLYLAVVLDLFSRQVVGWSMKPHMRRELVLDALRMAWFRRRPEQGAIVHSDRGSQYCSHEFEQALKGYGLRSSIEPQGRLLGQRARREPVGIAEGGAGAWQAL